MSPATSPATPERSAFAMPGIAGILLLFVLAALAAAAIFVAAMGATPLLFAGIPLVIAFFVSWGGFFTIQPNQAEVLVFLGRYRGTVRRDGWYWTNPFTTKRKISLRVQNFNTPKIKVNDADGNPIEIAAVVVWQVRDTARAGFDVENYPQFVEIQSETALRHIASTYPYDHPAKPGEPTLRGSAPEVGHALQVELQTRLEMAGMHVVETRLTHLAYSAEIAGAMLQRQQAAAIIAARQRIAQGAVGIIDSVLHALKEKKVVDLTATQRAEMVASLLVVLTSERGAQPVLNTLPGE